jgi:putative endonuclease
MFKPATRWRGMLAEQRACRYLKQQGLRLITRNYYCRFGEIDLIMWDGDCLVFVEVRSRRSGQALESVTTRKQQKIMYTSQMFITDTPTLQFSAMRYDIIAIQQSQIQWMKNAFVHD